MLLHFVRHFSLRLSIYTKWLPLLFLISLAFSPAYSQQCFKLKQRVPKSKVYCQTVNVKPVVKPITKPVVMPAPPQPVPPVKTHDKDKAPVEDQDTNKDKVDWAYSPVDLVFLAKQEEGIFYDVMLYKRSLEKKLRMVDSWLTDYEESSLAGTTHLTKNIHQWSKAEAVAAHPLMTFRMIRRFSHNMYNILRNIKDMQMEKKLLKKIKLYEEEFRLPNRTDLENTMDSILKIQHVYDLDAAAIMSGKISSAETAVGLTAEQAFEIGVFAGRNEVYPEALNWLLSVAARATVDPFNRIDFKRIRRVVDRVIENHDDLIMSLTPAMSPVYPHRFSNTLLSQRIVQTYKKTKTDELRRDRKAEASYANYVTLCSGTNYLRAPGDPMLSCWLDRWTRPAWKISPLKVEAHSWIPYLVQVHDVIGENMIHFLREEAVPSLARAEPGAIKYPNVATRDFSSPTLVSRLPTFSTTTLFEKDYKEELGRLSLKIRMITQMETVNDWDESEGIEVSAHAFGGHLYPSVQNGGGHNKVVGDRFATFMIYLTDVELGGQTVFPVMGTAVEPVKGSALIWFNYLRNGMMDDRGMHGECPVIMGHKWIATKWIRANSNFLSSKC